MSKSIYRVRGSNTVRLNASVSDETLGKLKTIQAAFCERWPAGQYPTLSAILEHVLTSHARELEADPSWLDSEVAEFRHKYSKKSA